MQNKLQELTEKIYKEGLSKGTEEANQILAKAKDEAVRIVADAKKEAEKIVSQARKEADDYKKNVETETSISVRQVFSGLKLDIAKLIESEVLKSPVIDALKDAEFLKKIIETAIQNWNKVETENVSLNLLVPADLQKSMNEHFNAKTLAKLNVGLNIIADNNISYGFKIGPQDNSYIINFTDNDFESLFREYVRPRIVTMLFGGK
jgi:V/A-type H+-transporting ATPase subunit E